MIDLEQVEFRQIVSLSGKDNDFNASWVSCSMFSHMAKTLFEDKSSLIIIWSVMPLLQSLSIQNQLRILWN